MVHDVTPAIAGVTSHLLDVALRTPTIEDMGGSRFRVVQLGDSDLSAPIASQVISEVSEIPRFDPHVHAENSLCVLSFSGCDTDVLGHSGLSERATPVCSLLKLASNSKPLSQLPIYTTRELIQLGSVAPADRKNFCDSNTGGCCADLSITAFLIADCVSIFVRALAQSADVVKTLRTE